MNTFNIKELAESVQAGKVVVYPTETLYAIGCSGFDQDAVRKVYAIKNRPVGKPLPLVIGDVSQLSLVTDHIGAGLETLASAFWPGPLSILVKAGKKLAPQVRDRQGFTSVRVTPHPVAGLLSIAARVPLVATSANISGGPPAALPGEIDKKILTLADSAFLGEPYPGGGKASTVARFIRENEIEILRHGAVSDELIKSKGFKIIARQ